MATLAPAGVSSATPILDGVAPLPVRRKSAWGTLVQVIIGISVGLVISLPGITLVNFSSGAQNPFTPLIILFEIIAANYLAVIVHECGHLISGLSAGLRLNFVRFGPLQINPPFRLSWHWRTGTAAAGLASLLPASQRDFRRQYCILLAGGAAANIALASILYLFFRPLSTFWSIFAVINAILGFANLLPFTRRNTVSDGKRLLMLLRHNRQGERWYAIIRLSTDLWDGVPPENLNADLLATLTGFTDKLPDTVSAHVLAHTAAFHSHRDAEAACLLETALQHSAQAAIPTRQSLITTAGIFQARRAHKAESARQWLSLLPQKTHWPGLRQDVEAAILECESQLDAALAKLEESERLASAMPLGMQRDINLMSLKRWKSELEQQKNAAALTKNVTT